jgi:uncharacterized protein
VLYLLFLVPFLLLGNFVKRRLVKTFRQYSSVASSNGMTGAEVARKLLDDNDMRDVTVGMAKGGPLSDHYDPRSRSVNLSQEVYASPSLAATSVAAHEVGHAMQHNRGWALFRFRSALAPLVGLASKAWFFVAIASSFLRMPKLFYAAIAIYAILVLFQLVTLPVELDASRRARMELQENHLLRPDEDDDSGRVLHAAAWTYVAGTLASIGQLAMYALPLLLGGLGRSTSST